jgi:hypothetical protein
LPETPLTYYELDKETLAAIRDHAPPLLVMMSELAILHVARGTAIPFL